MPLDNKLGTVVALVAIGLLASFGLVLPARDISLYGLSFTLSGRTLLGFVVLGLVCTGTDAIVRGHPKIEPHRLHPSFLHWIVPAALTTATWILLTRPESITNKIIGVAVASWLLALLVSAEYYTVDLTARWRGAVQFSLRLMTYLLATLLYLATYLSSPRLRVGGTLSAGLTAPVAVAVSSAILSLRLLCDDGCPLQRLWPYMLSLGALLGLVSWRLNLWISSPLLLPLVLTVLLYVLTGLARQLLLGKLTRGVVVEYLGVGLLVLLFLLFYAQ